MRKPQPRLHKRRKQRNAKGSALLVSLMVMVGLSLLGLSFVAISETENAISVNERNKTQTSGVAEAGAKTVVQWFQDPNTFLARGLLPANDDDFKIVRKVAAYEGRYKPDGGDVLCDTPFGPREPNMFFGNEENADIQILASAGGDAKTFLDTLNAALFVNGDAGSITAIRIYAPPVVGGILTGGFWVGGQRYGIATIAVTAEKTNTAGAVIAQSVCRIVVAPFPLPGPGGAIQAGGGIATNGAYIVHWGAVETEDAGNTYVKREFTSFPWFDAYDRAYIEYGLDSSFPWKANTAYYAGQIVRPSNAAIAKVREYVVTVAGSTDASEPAWDTDTVNDNGMTFTKRTPTIYPIVDTSSPAGYGEHAWLYEMLNRQVEDPWFHVRTRGRVDGKEYGAGPVGQPHAYDYVAAADANMAIAGNFVNGGQNKSHYFQYQTYNNRPLYKVVSIPKFDYDFWKSSAIAGRGQEGVYYLEHKGSGSFSDGVTTQSFSAWVTSKEGFLFFDSNNNLNPQNGAGTLVAGGADVCGAKGVIYMNYDMIKSTGCNGVNGYYNMPAEPFRDMGYRKVNEETVGLNAKKDFTVDAGGAAVYDKGYNGQWDFQDLEWSNNGAAKNEIFDVCIKQRTVKRESDGSMQTFWLPAVYYPGCNVGNNIDTPTCDCSEPFEPYLNIDYNGSSVGVTARWEDPNANTSTYPKKTTNEKPTGTLETCTAAAVKTEAGQTICATNAYDKRGAMAWIEKSAGNAAIGVEGVLYNEGQYDSTGNAAYYGSVVVKGSVSPNGTQEIWFDECLAKDCWPPPHIPFPRVLITSTQIQ